MAATQRISANAISALKDAMTAVFWFKRDLYNYAKAAVGGDPTFLAGIDWTSPDQYKRDSVNLFVDRLVREQDDHQDLLLALLVAARPWEARQGWRASWRNVRTRTRALPEVQKARTLVAGLHRSVVWSA